MPTRRGLDEGGAVDEDRAAFGGIADAKGADREEQDEERDRHPGQLLAVQALEDEIVRGDQGDEIDQQEQADDLGSRRIQGRTTHDRVRKKMGITAAIRAGMIVLFAVGDERQHSGGGGGADGQQCSPERPIIE